MTVLVAYATRYGATAEIAERIALTLIEEGVDARAQQITTVRDLAGVDAFVIGSAVYFGSWLKPATAFVERHRGTLADRPLWLFSSGPLDQKLARAQLPITQHGSEITDGLGARDHRTFGGRLLPEAPIDPHVLETHPIGDFRDWDAIGDYARVIAKELAAMTFPTANGQ